MSAFNSITEKALVTNLAHDIYGTFAEIGAGQEVVRHFYRAGNASGTVAKSMSAYDKRFSDDIYGKEARYVCENRLKKMLSHEYELLLSRLDEPRGQDTRFFAYANTVTTDPKRGGHAWMGICFQLVPKGKVHSIVIHLRMLDDNRFSQQEVVGIAGVNLVHAAFEHHEDPMKLVECLKDHMGTRRLEVDMIRMEGPSFQTIDHRRLALHLVRTNLAKATMFDPHGETLQPAEMLYKKNVLVQRGYFRPMTKVNEDMIRSSLDQFCKDKNLEKDSVVVLIELTLSNLAVGQEEIDGVQDFLDRASCLQAMGYHVLISNYPEYYLLSQFLNTLTDGHIAMVIGTPRLKDIFDEKYYEHIEGGILEAFGKLFRNHLHVYAYPWQNREGYLITAYNLGVATKLKGLYSYLIDNNFITPLDNYSPELPRLRLRSSEVLEDIKNGNDRWKELVPEPVADLICQQQLLDYKA